MAASALISPPFNDAIGVAALAGDTPAVLVDAARMADNIARVADLAAAAGVALRPHAKTHKSIAIAEAQLAAGASGVTVAKASEAAVFLDGGVASITIAAPMVEADRIAAIVRQARDRGRDLRFIADSNTGIDALAAAAAASGVALQVYLKVDVGLHRCGVAPEAPETIDLARRMDAAARLRFAGLLSHAGHAYRVDGPDAVRGIAATEREIMTGLAATIRAAGVAVDAVSIGCTPTVILNSGFDGITEIRPGNYVFMDRIQVALGAAQATQVALWVAATVISCNSESAIIDAGSKTLSSDRGPHGSTAVAGYGLAWKTDDLVQPPLTVSSLSEEHGFLAHHGNPPRIGSRVIVMPNHACPVVNLADTLTVCTADGGRQTLRVDARGRVW
ncbi:MAG: alanine racemase [Hyphomicrobiales bacterium]|nr:alanine racemase [Hyphomicrobiales bacterium]